MIPMVIELTGWCEMGRTMEGNATGRPANTRTSNRSKAIDRYGHQRVKHDYVDPLVKFFKKRERRMQS